MTFFKSSDAGIVTTKVTAMILFIRWILFVSRPRIWIYTAGSFAIGVFAVIGSFSSFFPMDLLPLLIWLTVPANVFLYAINDACDYETDLHNPKKDTFENRVSETGKTTLIITAIVACLPLVFIFPGLPSEASALVILWFVLVVSYNIPGIRLKAVPILDNLFAFNFPLWGIIGYFLASGQFPSIATYALIALFAIAMHLYTSGIDVEYDRAAGVRTTSVLIGSVKANLLAGSGLVLATMGILIASGYFLIASAASLYLVFFLVQFFSDDRIELVRWYRYFIYLHYAAGFIFSLNFIKP